MFFFWRLEISTSMAQIANGLKWSLLALASNEKPVTMCYWEENWETVLIAAIPVWDPMRRSWLGCSEAVLEWQLSETSSLLMSLLLWALSKDRLAGRSSSWALRCNSIPHRCEQRATLCTGIARPSHIVMTCTERNQHKYYCNSCPWRSIGSLIFYVKLI